MQKADQPERWHQLRWATYWLIGTLLFVFLAGCFLDVGVIIAFPLIGVFSSIAWLALTVAGLRAGWAQRANLSKALGTALASTLAAAAACLAFLPVARASGFVQAYGVLTLNIDSYRKDIKRASSAGKLSKPLMWAYGGWLSIDRVIAYWPAGNPDRRLAAETGRGSHAYCRKLGFSFYDCTIDY